MSDQEQPNVQNTRDNLPWTGNRTWTQKAEGDTAETNETDTQDSAPVQSQEVAPDQTQEPETTEVEPEEPEGERTTDSTKFEYPEQSSTGTDENSSETDVTSEQQDSPDES